MKTVHFDEKTHIMTKDGEIIATVTPDPDGKTLYIDLDFEPGTVKVSKKRGEHGNYQSIKISMD